MTQYQGVEMPFDVGVFLTQRDCDKEMSVDDNAREMTSIIAQEMGDLLVRAPLSATENFFDSGGDSLRAIELLARLVDRYKPDESELAEQLRRELLIAIFDDATPAGLTSVVADHMPCYPRR